MGTSLRLEQYDTILYNSNLNPMGVPGSVKKALFDNLDNVVKYPTAYYSELKKAIAAYTGAAEDTIVLGNGSSDLLRLYTALLAPKKVLLPVPSFSEYEKVLGIYGCNITYYNLNEKKDFILDVSDLIANLDSSYDMLIIGNPNNPTSQIISREGIDAIAKACSELGIFLIIDEMYIEFTENYHALTSVPLTEKYTNLAVLRSVSKFFAVPGLRLAYSIMNNTEYMSIIELTSTPNSISVLTAAACIDMFSDKAYIEQSRSMIYTERNLIYSAMSTCKNIRLFKPYANFMLAKLLKDDVSARDIAEHCKLKGIIIRTCQDMRGLDESYIRFCFMKPAQNDLLVNTILDLL